ncbi:hypothetical protein [Halobellus ruber]|uniref:Uncharacterized protein n=1 Tax=Halobellus ruber TaxID=2761102 RepID=A0A7J9SDN6_9EURY|nr:hypothetical protein [Halobellus ruber]MBB6645035.1 hypothetical protein [Halobellus ruber]
MDTADGSLENNLSSGMTPEPDNEMITDGGFNTGVVESICEFVREDLDRGEWKIYYAKRIAKYTPYSAARIGWYLGKICGVQSTGQEIDIADFAPEIEIEQWIPASSVCRWRIERHAPSDTPEEANEPLVTDGGRRGILRVCGTCGDLFIEPTDGADTTECPDCRLRSDGGLSDSFDEFVDPQTDDDRPCESCGDAVPRRFLEEGVCIGCRVHQAAAEGQR